MFVGLFIGWLVVRLFLNIHPTSGVTRWQQLVSGVVDASWRLAPYGHTLLLVWYCMFLTE